MQPPQDRNRRLPAPGRRQEGPRMDHQDPHCRHSHLRNNLFLRGALPMLSGIRLVYERPVFRRLHGSQDHYWGDILRFSD